MLHNVASLGSVHIWNCDHTSQLRPAFRNVMVGYEACLKADGRHFAYLPCFAVQSVNVVHNSDNKSSWLAATSSKKGSRFLSYCACHAHRHVYFHPDIKNAECHTVILLARFPPRISLNFQKFDKGSRAQNASTSNGTEGYFSTALKADHSLFCCATERVEYTSTTSHAFKTCTDTVLPLYSSTLFNHFRKQATHKVIKFARLPIPQPYTSFFLEKNKKESINLRNLQRPSRPFSPSTATFFAHHPVHGAQFLWR